MSPLAVRAADTRRHETPNATMTTLASPTLSGSQDLAVWAVEMKAGARGPRHVFDAEQVWTVVRGALALTLGDDELQLAPGDSVTMPAGMPRQITARDDAHMLVCGRADAVVAVPGEDAPRGVPPWIA